jgi:hypothetical protein
LGQLATDAERFVAALQRIDPTGCAGLSLAVRRVVLASPDLVQCKR